ncbi:MAG: lipid-A-disaccharide synthase [Bacteroidales bacterium]|nr:lipid-A-disaccharide synthase [Bacteroidales bacterium]
MRYYLIAGEASGDMHAAGLMKELRKADQGAVFRCWGGDLMQAAGGELVKHYRDLAYMGFIEVVMNIRTIMNNLGFCKEDLLRFRPDVLILVDYPGFNLRIAEFAHRKGLKVVYYISPQVWAWKKSRVYGIRENVDKMLVILPFEEDFYRKYDYRVEFVGHPLLDIVNNPSAYEHDTDFRRANQLGDKPIIALLPGSRKQEIKRMLPVMVSMAGKFSGYEFVIAGAPSVDPALYREVKGSDEMRILYRQTHELLRHAHAAAVTSGTATLETALFGVPQVVCYRGSAVSYAIARRLVDVRYISLVNLIMDRQVVRELIQYEFNEENLEQEMNSILDEGIRSRIMADYGSLRKKLGGEGASYRAASSICKALGIEPGT